MGGQVITGVIAQVCLNSRLQTHSVIISPVPECITGVDKLSSWWNPCIGSLICEVRAK